MNSAITAKELAGMKRMHIEEYRFEKVKQMLEDITAVYEGKPFGNRCA